MITRLASSHRLPAATTPIALMAMAAAIWLSLYYSTFSSLSSADQLDYAQIARHVWQGDGFVTSVVYPIALSRFPSPFAQPDFLRVTLFPLVIAPFFGALGVNDRAVVAASGLAYILLPAAVYGLARRATGSQGTARLAGLMTLLSQELIEAGLGGLSELAFALALVITLYTVAREARPIVTGAAVGACFLLRMNFLVMLPGLALYWWMERPADGWNYVTKAAAVALLVASPWLVRNWLLAGSPLFTWQAQVGHLALKTKTYPETDVFRQIDPIDNLEFLRLHYSDVVSKMINTARLYYQRLPTLAHFLVMVGAMASLFLPGKPPRLRALQAATWGMLVFLAVSLLPIQDEMRFFLPLIPLLAIPAADFYQRALSESRTSVGLRNVAFAAIGLLMAVPLLPNFTGRVGRWDYDLIRQELAAPLSSCPTALVVTDAAWPVAWYLDRTTVVIPLTYRDLNRIEQVANAPVQVLFFYTGEQDKYGRNEQYQAEYFGNPAFTSTHRLTKTFESGARMYVYDAPGADPACR